MAKVEAMNFGLLQARGISSAVNNNNVSSKGNTERFQQIFSSKGNTPKEEPEGEQAPVSGKEFSVQNSKNFSQKEDYVAEVSDTAQVVENVDMKTQLQAVEEEMKQVVKDVLGIDDTILEQTMAVMGVVITDLLNPSILQEFVLQVSGGEENIDFLMNETLLQNFNDLYQMLTDFMEQNSGDVMLLMEALEQPVPFEGVLDTAVVEENVISQLSDEEMTETAGQSQVNVQTENVSANVQSAVKEHTAQSDKVSDMVEKVTIEKSETVQKVSDGSLEQNLSEDSGNEQLSQESMGQDATELLRADRSQVSTSTETGNPLFVEHMNVVQGNASQVIQSSLNGLQRMQQMVDIVNQVSEQIRSTVDASTTTMEMQLNPENLGKVLLTVSAKEGVMTASFKVQSEEARQALESQMYQLRETLEAKNLKVESVDVQISDFSFTQSNEAEGQMQKDFGRQGKKKFNFDVAEEEDDMEVSEETPEQTRKRVMLESGGSIDYTA